jgi:hypothetical protein
VRRSFGWWIQGYPDDVKLVGAAVLVCTCVLAAACGDAAEPTARAASRSVCPGSWQRGWRQLSRQIDAPVYCPAWIPNPLDGRIGGDVNGLRLVDRRGGFLVSFIYQETGTGEVHVNFHRWPGTRMPLCRAETSRRLIPCYSEPRGRVSANGIDATLYTVSRDADQWHLSYLWHHDGATYVVSEHVAPPYSFVQVKRNLTRILRNLVLVPTSP